MPPDASSQPEIGLNRTDTSTSPYGPPGARITLNLLLVARCTSARPSREAPATSSMPHAPEMICHPSKSLVKSNRSSGPAGHAKRLAADAHVPKSVVATMSLRLDNLMQLLHSACRFFR